MEGTTKGQDKIRRVTLLISVLLLLSSVGSYLLYQHFYQSELQVTFVSRKILPKTGTAKKTSQRLKETQVNHKNVMQTNVSKELTNDRSTVVSIEIRAPLLSKSSRFVQNKPS